MISHWIYIDLRNNKNGLQKGEFSSKGRKLLCLYAMPQGGISSLLSTKTVRKLHTIFQTLMKTIIVLINENKNCLQDILCVRDYVAVSRCFCHGARMIMFILFKFINNRKFYYKPCRKLKYFYLFVLFI